MSYALAYALFALLWALASLGGGALLALLAHRLHPALPYRNLWLFYSALLAFATGAVLAIALL